MSNDMRFVSKQWEGSAPEESAASLCNESILNFAASCDIEEYRTEEEATIAMIEAVSNGYTPRGEATREALAERGIKTKEDAADYLRRAAY